MEMLARNSRMYGSETALIEREPAKNSERKSHGPILTLRQTEPQMLS